MKERGEERKERKVTDEVDKDQRKNKGRANNKEQQSRVYHLVSVRIVAVTRLPGGGRWWRRIRSESGEEMEEGMRRK